MLAHARADAPEGLWLRADAQHDGRGRQGRHWSSPLGNLYASTLVRLHASDPPAATLALVGAVALEQLLSAYATRERVRIKWPNDLLLDGAKVSGMLLERADDAVVVGFGVNLAHHPAGLDRAVTSFAGAGLAVPAPEALLAELAPAFAYWLSRWRGEDLAPVRARWLERAHPPGTPLIARLGDGGALEGVFDGLDEAGALRLRTAQGLRLVRSGDVFLL